MTDFDGNPVLPAAERMLPIPAALDVAGMAQSLATPRSSPVSTPTLDAGSAR